MKSKFIGINDIILKGDIRYIAPEVENGENYDTKADIYSLGMILKDKFDISFNQRLVL
jgi:serine/threonine protein kinase